MVQEVRHIILSKDEMISALECHSRMTPNFLPKGKIVDFDILAENSIMVTVETEPDAQEASVIFTDLKLIYALIRFCVENNIMLPREGRKTVMIGPSSVSLCINLDIETYVASNMEPLRLAGFAVQ